jgi:hypothetical protein
MQSEGKKAPGEPKKYANAFKAYGIIARWAACMFMFMRHGCRTRNGIKRC